MNFVMEYHIKVFETGLLFLLSFNTLAFGYDPFIVFIASFGHNVRSPVTILETLDDEPSTLCAYVCFNRAACAGYNYWLSSAGQSRHCDLLTTKPNPALMAAETGVTYFENMDYDECLSNPCQNSGTCTDEYAAYSCTCIAGITGHSCETNIDECASAPCLHGSTCVDGVNGYTCNCLPGFSGSHCQICPIMKMGANCDQDCKLTVQGKEYNGTIHRSENGRTCQRWDKNLPHIHTYKDPSAFPDATLSDAGNNCRTPDNEPRPWCYTVYVFHRWEYCTIPLCP